MLQLLKNEILFFVALYKFATVCQQTLYLFDAASAGTPYVEYCKIFREILSGTYLLASNTLPLVKLHCFLH